MHSFHTYIKYLLKTKAGVWHQYWEGPSPRDWRSKSGDHGTKHRFPVSWCSNWWHHRLWYGTFFLENWHKARRPPRAKNRPVVPSHHQTIRKPERLSLPSPGDISTSVLHGNSQGLLTQISSLPTTHSLASTGRRGVLSQHDQLLLNALFSQSQNQYSVLLVFILWNQMFHCPPIPSLSHFFHPWT